MIGFHIFPTLALLPGTSAAFAPAFWSRKITDINTRAFTRFHFFPLSNLALIATKSEYQH